jgi:hypothetical protein
VLLSSRNIALLLLTTLLESSIVAQNPEPTASLLVRFDNEHNLAAKEGLLLAVTNRDAGAGPSLLRLAESTTSNDTRWMAMRGMATLHFTDCAPFLQASLKASDRLVRANAARALGDLRIGSASASLLAMFVAESDPGAIQQASLSLRMLDVRAAVPYVRAKIPSFTGQTRAWLIQALGTLGSAADVPLIAGYLDDMGSDTAATAAIQELAGVSFGPRSLGLGAYPPPETLAARTWWKSHKDAWPHCDDCHPK